LAANIDETPGYAKNKNWSYQKVLLHLIDLEIERRKRSRIDLRFRQSWLNEQITIDQFEFEYHNSKKDQNGSNLFFQVISSRHQVRSTLITTNQPFSEWGKIFDSTTAATAIDDRLVHHLVILATSLPATQTKKSGIFE